MISYPSANIDVEGGVVAVVGRILVLPIARERPRDNQLRCRRRLDGNTILRRQPEIAAACHLVRREVEASPRQRGAWAAESLAQGSGERFDLDDLGKNVRPGLGNSEVVRHPQAVAVEIDAPLPHELIVVHARGPVGPWDCE